MQGGTTKESRSSAADDLARGHYYNSGFAWLLLLGRLDVSDWRERVELAPPDQVLAEAIGTCNGAAADALFDVALTDAGWENAQASAVGTVEQGLKACLRSIREDARDIQPRVGLAVSGRAEGPMASVSPPRSPPLGRLRVLQHFLVRDVAPKFATRRTGRAASEAPRFHAEHGCALLRGDPTMLRGRLDHPSLERRSRFRDLQ
jgi:hypothetical protein